MSDTLAQASAGYPFQVTFDCAQPQLLGAFWAIALGYAAQAPPDGFDSWDAFADSINLPATERQAAPWALVDPAGRGPRLLFLMVPEGKTAKNRLHLDVNVGGRLAGDERKPVVRAHADLLVAHGATLVEERQDQFSSWITMADPEGNEFCVQ